MGLGLSRTWINFYCRHARPHMAVSVGGVVSKFVTNTPELYHRVKKLGGEEAQLEAFLCELREGDVVWDIGSFVGMFALFSAKAVGPRGKVFAFEPEPAARALLSENCKLNSAKTLTIMDVALSDTEGDGHIYPAPEGAQAIHSLKPGDLLSSEGIPIRLARGDALISRNEAQLPNVLKVDVEGAELLVLKGLNKTLSSSACRFLFLELHHRTLPKFGARPEDVMKLLKNAGFEVGNRIERGSESHLFLYKRQR